MTVPYSSLLTVKPGEGIPRGMSAMAPTIILHYQNILFNPFLVAVKSGVSDFDPYGYSRPTGTSNCMDAELPAGYTGGFRAETWLEDYTDWYHASDVSLCLQFAPDSCKHSGSIVEIQDLTTQAARSARACVIPKEPKDLFWLQLETFAYVPWQGLKWFETIDSGKDQTCVAPDIRASDNVRIRIWVQD